MKLVIQRCDHASVTVLDKVASVKNIEGKQNRNSDTSIENKRLVGSIDKGMCVFVGIHESDSEKDVDICVRKLLKIRLWHRLNKPEDTWLGNVVDHRLQILIVSQFTLYADTSKPKPDFRRAMPPEKARILFDSFVRKVKTVYLKDSYIGVKGKYGQKFTMTDEEKNDKMFELVQTGEFGALMKVNICNDGPCTMTIESQSDKDLNVASKSSAVCISSLNTQIAKEVNTQKETTISEVLGTSEELEKINLEI